MLAELFDENPTIKEYLNHAPPSVNDSSRQPWNSTEKSIVALASNPRELEHFANTDFAAYQLLHGCIADMLEVLLFETGL